MSATALSLQEESQNTLDWYVKQLRRYPLLTAQEEYTLALQAKQGNTQARETFINANLSLVVYVVSHISPKWGRLQQSELSFEDLIQYGNIGLIRAVDAFDPDHGPRFIHYAIFWIYREIRRYLLEFYIRGIKMPSGTMSEALALRNSHPTSADATPNQPQSRSPAEWVLNSGIIQVPKSLEDNFLFSGDEGEYIALGEMIPDPLSDFTGSVISAIQAQALADLIEEYLQLAYFSDEEGGFSRENFDRDLAIVLGRLMPKEQELQTFIQLGKRYGITRQRVQQIYSRALDYLRRNSRFCEALAQLTRPILP